MSSVARSQHREASLLWRRVQSAQRQAVVTDASLLTFGGKVWKRRSSSLKISVWRFAFNEHRGYRESINIRKEVREARYYNNEKLRRCWHIQHMLLRGRCYITSARWYCLFRLQQTAVHHAAGGEETYAVQSLKTAVCRRLYEGLLVPSLKRRGVHDNTDDNDMDLINGGNSCVIKRNKYMWELWVTSKKAEFYFVLRWVLIQCGRKWLLKTTLLKL